MVQCTMMKRKPLSGTMKPTGKRTASRPVWASWNFFAPKRSSYVTFHPLRPVLLDVGGATGAHAQWLVAEGYEVHIVDLTPRHVEKALADLGPHGVTAEVGDARELNASSQSYDSVLLLGPMYHLTSRSDRVKCLQEALRVVRTDGVVAVAAISRFASLCDGLARGFFFDPKFRKIVERDLAEGQHRNPENVPHWFTTAYFHEPQELQSEIEDAGMQVRTLVGVEGPAGCMKHLVERWDTPEDREAILYAARAVESEPSIIGMSGHLLAIGEPIVLPRRGRTPTGLCHLLEVAYAWGGFPGW